MGNFGDFFAVEGFMPHGVCLLWKPEVFWLHFVSDVVISLAYYSIPMALIYFVWRRRDVVFSGTFRLFGLFILACGTTHAFSIWTLWNPDYGISGLVKLVTAMVSIATAVHLWRIMPRALALPALEGINQRLQQEVNEREQAEGAVRRLNEELEDRVQLRTAELESARQRLETELAERERMGETLRHTLETLEAVVESSPMAIIGLDPQGRVLSWNRSARDIFGFSAAEVTGRPLPIVPEGRNSAYEELLRRVTSAETVRSIEAVGVRKDASQVPLRMSGAPLNDELEGSRGTVVVLEDVTDSAAMRRQLEQAQRMEAVGQLSGGMAHDFNNLLSVVIGNLDMLTQELESNPTALEMAGKALAAAMRGAELTRQLLAFSRRQSLAARPLDINALVAGTAGLLGSTLGEQIKIELKLADDTWPVLADPIHVESALANMAINARDAMRDGGTLTLETANAELAAAETGQGVDGVSGDFVRLTVTDTGTGMSRSVLEHAFEPFFTTKEQGSGLGLSMIYGFARQSGGHVEIDSTAGEGTSVSLYLPRAAEDVKQEEDTAEPAVTGHAGTVLVVEDRQDVREVAVAQLTSLGFEVIEAEDASAALEILRGDTHLDLLFTDVIMPGGMSGIGLAEAAAELRPSLKVLFATGYSDTAGGEGEYATIPGPLLTKPYRMKDLAAKVSEILDAEA